MRRINRINVKNELLVINLCSLVLILIISVLDIQALRIVLGLPFLLFFPGYAIIASLFPKKSDLGATERLALSIGLSVVTTPLMGLIVGLVWEVRLYPIVVSLTILIAAFSATAWYRRRNIPEDDRPTLRINLGFRGGGNLNMLDRVVSLVLVLGMIAAVVILAYAVATPKVGERFTELYILGSQSLSRQLTVGDEATVVLGVVNHEHEAMSYGIEVLIGEQSVSEVGPIVLDQGERWENTIGFVPTEVSAHTKVTEDITIQTSPAEAEVKAFKVESTDNLEPGDKLMIGQESAVVQQIEDHTLVLEEGVRENHPLGTEVIEAQRVEFRLIKYCELSDNGETSLGLWVGKEHLVAAVRYQGANEASYRIDVRISGGQNEDPVGKSAIGPRNQATGDTWTSETDYPFSEMNEIQFSLYKDEGLLYRTSESEPYPSVYLWVIVT